jgi:hypothetical protein
LSLIARWFSKRIESVRGSFRDLTVSHSKYRKFDGATTHLSSFLFCAAS